MDNFNKFLNISVIALLLCCGISSSKNQADGETSEKPTAEQPASAANSENLQDTGISPPSPPGNGDGNFALLVGINKYPNLPSRYQLKGCVNDVKVMEKMLLEVFDFKPENIKILLDEDATKSNILGNIENYLIKNAKKDGQVMFYYSGHGSRITDLNGDEADGWDESMVTHDSRDPAGKVKDILDDELEPLLGRLAAACDNVTLIMDCCNSGSGFRGEDPSLEMALPRLAPDVELGQPGTQSASKPNDGPSGFLPPNPNYVLISACKDKEYAYERNGNGALTKALNEVIRENPNNTYRAMMYEVFNRVNSNFASQHPQIEGPRRNAVIFGSLGKVQKFVEVKNVKNDVVLFNAGKAHGVTVGSIYAIYKSGTTNTENEDAYLAKAEITAVEPFQAAAKISDKKGEIPVNASAFEIAHQYGDMQLAVFLNLDEHATLKQKIVDELNVYKNKEDLVKLVPGNQDFQLRVLVDRDSIVIESPDQVTLKKYAKNDSKAVEKVLDVLTKQARRLNVYRLENKNTKLKTNLSLKCWEKVEEDIFGNQSIVNPLPLKETPGGQLELDAGNVIQLTITNESTKPVYVYLLDIATDGGVYLRFPSQGAEDSPMAPGASIDSYPMEITGPKGLNTLKLIATTQPTDFWSLTQTGFRSVPAGGSDSPLGKLLNLAWGGTRDVRVLKPKEPGDWATNMVTFLIQ